MSTTMPKAGEVERKWYVIDAAGKPLGRVAAQAAVLLRGKHKPTFAPHVDCGDHVIVIKDGKKYDEGPPEKVITPEMLREVYHVDCEILHVPGHTRPLIVYSQLA